MMNMDTHQSHTVVNLWRQMMTRCHLMPQKPNQYLQKSIIFYNLFKKQKKTKLHLKAFFCNHQQVQLSLLTVKG